ncbi:MAG: hypothetical protein B9J98_06970 [Candidatus Terraquivivens tikiterensis]|uniref:CN hydrolase domain-containing protein n=1 Tax=Candidatus Terraquivivens tikiterensis TaxID=1980982 RepID=A0A2R7Y138_9ARCH|nr:MAG: hypothetical protein B9J98_06970 [Candidatus Terraquivivens tikiterensis]
MRQGVKVAAVQVELGDGIKENVARAESLLRGAAKAGAEVACLPEMWLHKEPYPNIEEVIGSADYVVSEFSRLSRELKIATVLGAVYEEDVEGTFVSAYVIDSEGRVVGKQRKVHLFRDERRFFKPGSSFEVFEVDGIKLGVMVCYDVAFPESARCLTLKGAEIIFNPSRVVREALEPWRLYVRARCLENRVPVVAVNVSNGAHPGNSFVCVPVEGAKRFVHPVILSQAGSGPNVIVCEVDLLSIVGSRLDRLSRRVPAAYGCLLRQNAFGEPYEG